MTFSAIAVFIGTHNPSQQVFPSKEGLSTMPMIPRLDRAL
jgi:hypothetical protein